MSYGYFVGMVVRKTLYFFFAQLLCFANIGYLSAENKQHCLMTFVMFGLVCRSSEGFELYKGWTKSLVFIIILLYC